MLDRVREVAVEQRRATLRRAEDAVIKPTRVSGFEKTVGAGEVSVTVKFPVWFVQRPSMSFGAELEEGQFVQDLLFPTVSVVVIKWTKKYPERAGGYYVGCVLACVTTGKEDQRVVIHWQAEAKAMSIPSQPHTQL